MPTNDLKALVQEAIEPGVFGYQQPLDLEDPEVEELCERKGYGYVMSLAESLWSKKEGKRGGNHTVAACAIIRKKWCDKAIKALEREESRAAFLKEVATFLKEFDRAMVDDGKWKQAARELLKKIKSGG